MASAAGLYSCTNLYKLYATGCASLYNNYGLSTVEVLSQQRYQFFICLAINRR
jgi:hypothetical protein